MAEFIFADDYRLDESQTRHFYESFLRGLVHKHNNLMGVIQGFSSLILYDDSINDEIRESAQQMQDSARVASDLNKEALPAAGCARCDRSPIQLGDMMNFWKDKVDEISRPSGITVQFSVREDLPAVIGDGGKITEVFLALVRNAIEGAVDAGGGSVAVDIFGPGEASPGRNVDLFVRNTSVSLDDAALEKCYEPFHTTKGAEHFGIGLTMAAVMAGQMGMRLGLRHADATTTAWIAMPPAE